MFGLASQAAAVPEFTVDPAALGGTDAPFTASFMAGDSTSRMDLHADTQTVDGFGYINFSGFSNNGAPISAGRSGLGVDYTLWVTYEYTTSLTSGVFGAPGSDYTVTSLTYTLWGAQGDWSEDFTPVDQVTGAAPIPASPASALVLGSGALISGSASFTADGGAAFNSTASFNITGAGEAFFVDPRPFYNLAFNEFNNTSQGLVRVSADTYAIVSASGGVDFNSAAVPEPMSIALFGLGLLGIGAATRRRGA